MIDTLEDAGKIYLRGSDHILHFGGNISGDRRDMRSQTAPTSQLRIDATVQKFSVSVLAKTLCFSVIICNLIKTYPLPNPCKVFVEVKDCPLNFALKRIKFNFT